MWRAPDGSDWAIWAVNSKTYEVALMTPTGGVKEATALHWAGGGIANNPVLVAHGAKPVLVFPATGPVPYSLGALVGFVPGKWGSPWTGLSWSLSRSTIINGYYGAARNSAGVFSAAWSGSPALDYRIGVSGSIPASTADKAISLSSGDVGFVSEAVKSSNQDFYAAFGRFFTKKSSTDGVYVADLTTHGPVTKAPGSGTQSVSRETQDVAFTASTAKHGGLFAVYCNNSGSCSHLLLWKVGSKHSVLVPGNKAKFPGDWPSISAGPDGRIWIAWFNGANNRVYTVRTNKADTRFGPIESYSSGLGTLDTITVNGGPSGRLDVVVGGVTNNFKPTIIYTQSLTGLQLSPGKVSFHNTSSRKVVFKVTDAGDPVAGATVKVAGHRGVTDAGGAVTIKFAKGTKPGKYQASAHHADYFAGTARVVVRK